MDKVQSLLCTSSRLVRERAPSLLAGEAAVTHLINVIKVRQPSDHLLADEGAERLEADVAEPFVPPPCRLRGARR
jgi:hypothetical protein